MQVATRDIEQEDGRFYVTGGTLPHDARSYVRRKADDEVYQSLLDREFCYLLTSRQMGKSSLMVRAAERLRRDGISVAALDLTSIGQSVNPEQWYRGLLSRTGRQLGLEDEVDRYWSEHDFLSPLQRWMATMRDVVLDGCPDALVVFIDEIDVVRSLPFPTDEFFASIRACYNHRTQDPDLRRLTFCLLGVATPGELIQDVRTTPFNIGRRIELTDFTEAEAAPLAKGLERERGRAGEGETDFRDSYIQAFGRSGASTPPLPIFPSPLLKRVLYWTGGHPYLTQRLCQAIVDQTGEPTARDVDRLCADLFFKARAQETDDNLAYVRHRLLKCETDVATVLGEYARVRGRVRSVPDDVTNIALSTLRLSGVIRVSKGRVRIRNRIYARTFDRAWIAASMPDAEARRQRIAYRRGLIRATAVATVIVMIVGSLAFMNASWARRAVEKERRARRFVYVSQISLAQNAIESGDIGRASELVNSQIPGPDEEDLRGFEWHFLDRLCEHRPVAAFPGHRDVVTCVVFSADSRKVVTCSADGRTRLFDVSSQKEIATIGSMGDGIQVAAFSPDGRVLATGGWHFGIRLWDAASGRYLYALTGHQDAVRSMEFSPDGKMLATGSWDSTVRLWSVPRRREQASLTSGHATVASIAFSPDGMTLAAGYGDTTVKLWDVSRRTIRREIQAHKASVGAVYSPDGRAVAFGKWESMVKLWTVTASKRETATMRGHTSPVVCVAYSPAGDILATGGEDGNVRLWDSRTTRAIATLRGRMDPVVRMKFSRDGRTLVTGIWNGIVKFWDMDTKREVAMLRGHTDEITSIAFSPNGKYLATSSWDQTALLWNAARESESEVGLRDAGSVLSIDVASDSRTIAAGCADGRIHLWRANDPVCSYVLRAHSGAVMCVAFDRGGGILASGGVDGDVRLWRVDTGGCMSVLRGGRPSVLSVAFSPNGQVIATGSADGSVNFWDVKKSERIANLKWHLHPVLSLAFSPDGRYLVSGCADSTIKVWDTSKKREVISLRAHTGGVTAVAFAPNGSGSTFATCSYDGTVVLWDTNTWKPLDLLKGHRGWVQTAAFSRDGKTLATGGNDDTIKLWNVATGQEMLTLAGHSGPVQALAFASNGSMLVSGGDDGTVRLWRADSPHHAAQLATRAPKKFSLRASLRRRQPATQAEPRPESSGQVSGRRGRA